MNFLKQAERGVLRAADVYTRFLVSGKRSSTSSLSNRRKHRWSFTSVMHINKQLMPKGPCMYSQTNRLWFPSSAQGYAAGGLGDTAQGSPQVMWL